MHCNSGWPLNTCLSACIGFLKFVRVDNDCAAYTDFIHFLKSFVLLCSF